MAGSKISYQLARRIRALRLRKNLTQEDAAGLAGMDVRHYQKFESLKRPQSPRLETLEKLAKALKLPLWKLLQFKD